MSLVLYNPVLKRNWTESEIFLRGKKFVLFESSSINIKQNTDQFNSKEDYYSEPVKLIW